MSEFLSDSYKNDTKSTIRQLALTAAAAEDYHLAQQLYGILHDLQLRDEDTIARLAARVEQTAPPVLTLAQPPVDQTAQLEPLRLVPRIAGPDTGQLPTIPPGACVKCGGTARMLIAGLCDVCHYALCVCGGEIRFNRDPAHWRHTGRGPFPPDCPGIPRSTVQGGQSTS